MGSLLKKLALKASKDARKPACPKCGHVADVQPDLDMIARKTIRIRREDIEAAEKAAGMDALQLDEARRLQAREQLEHMERLQREQAERDEQAKIAAIARAAMGEARRIAAEEARIGDEAERELTAALKAEAELAEEGKGEGDGQ